MLEGLELLIDLHRNAERQGPGGDDETRLSITLSRLKAYTNLKIADIGCGTGASTLVLTEELEAEITAVDFLPEFLAVLDRAAQQSGVRHRIRTLAESMEELPFEEQSLDAIWSEGAIYNMGFENGIKSWSRFLKPEGILAVSELTWLTNERPDELHNHWMQEYPEVGTASEKLAILENNGFSPLGYFTLPKHCWLDNYYRPMQARFETFLDTHGHSDDAKAVVEAEKGEIELYERYSDFISYGYYIAKRT